MAKNVIIIYIDTVSRTQSFRKLKKTMSFFKRYAGTNYKDTTEAEDFDEQTNTKYKKNKTTFEVNILSYYILYFNLIILIKKK